MTEKMNPAVTENLEEKLASLNRTIVRGRRVLQLKGNDGWLAAQEIARDHLKGAEYVLANPLQYDNRAIDVALTQKNTLMFFIEIVSEFETKADLLTLRVQETQSAIDERRTKQQRQ